MSHHHHNVEPLMYDQPPNKTRPEVHGWPSLFRFSKSLLIIVGCFLVAITSGMNNAFNPIATDMMHAEHLSFNQFNVLVAFGLVGYFFTVPAGVLNDFIGPFRTGLIGMVCVGAGYIGLSFLDHSLFPLMVVCLCISGFGGGFTFTAALATSIKVLRLHPGIAVFIVGGGMSLSLAFSSLAIEILKDVSGCDAAQCWPSHVRLLGVLGVVFQLPCCLFAFRLFEIAPEFKNWAEPAPAPSEHHNDDEIIEHHHGVAESTAVTVKLPFSQSWVIVKSLFAWVVALAYTVGIGSGLMVISQTEGLISNFGGNSGWVFAVSMAFSLCNAILGGALGGFLGDFVTSRYGVRRCQVYGATLIVSSLIFFALGTLSSEPTPHDSSSQVFFNLLLICVGIFFGANFVYAPSIMAEAFGGPNFGVFFGYMQILTAAATFAVPAIAGSNLQHAGNCVATFFGFQYLLSFFGVLLLFAIPKKLDIDYELIK